MANDDQVACLRMGVEKWNHWRTANPSEDVDLAGCVLGGFDLSGAFLQRAELSGAYLGAAKLRRTRLDYDDAVMDSTRAWAAKVRDNRHIGDFTRWKDHDAYQKAFERLLRDLKRERA